MIKNFVKYNESAKDELVVKVEYSLHDLWEEHKNEDDRIEYIATFVCKTFKNKILTFTTKKNELIEKINIKDVVVKIRFEKFLKMTAIFVDENDNEYEVKGRKKIEIWEKFNPIDPYGEEEW
jgi:hypothetical protein